VSEAKAEPRSRLRKHGRRGDEAPQRDETRRIAANFAIRDFERCYFFSLAASTSSMRAMIWPGVLDRSLALLDLCQEALTFFLRFFDQRGGRTE
jgi:hypothetical protein